jgi:hypothetical protein
MIKKDKFESSWWSNVGFFGVCGLILIFLGYTERGLDESTLEGAGILLVVMLFLIWIQSRNYIEIKDNRSLIIRGQTDFGHYDIDIFSIKYIRRSPAFLFLRTWGSLVAIFALDKEGNLKKVATIREKNFSKDAIKDFLKRLTGINPNIHLDSEYNDLLAGKYDDASGYFTMTPAKKSLDEIEKELDLR